jgi:hypothetical protein
MLSRRYNEGSFCSTGACKRLKVNTNDLPLEKKRHRYINSIFFKIGKNDKTGRKVQTFKLENTMKMNIMVSKFS